MKLLLIALASVTLVSCKKKEEVHRPSGDPNARPQAYVPCSDPGPTPGGGSSATSSESGTHPPLAEQGDNGEIGLERSRQETSLGEGGRQADAGSNRPSAGGQGHKPEKKQEK